MDRRPVAGGPASALRGAGDRIGRRANNRFGWQHRNRSPVSASTPRLVTTIRRLRASTHQAVGPTTSPAAVRLLELLRRSRRASRRGLVLLRRRRLARCRPELRVRARRLRRRQRPRPVAGRRPGRQLRTLHARSVPPAPVLLRRRVRRRRVRLRLLARPAGRRRRCRAQRTRAQLRTLRPTTRLRTGHHRGRNGRVRRGHRRPQPARIRRPEAQQRGPVERLLRRPRPDPASRRLRLALPRHPRDLPIQGSASCRRGPATAVRSMPRQPPQKRGRQHLTAHDCGSACRLLQENSKTAPRPSTIMASASHGSAASATAALADRTASPHRPAEIIVMRRPVTSPL